MRNPFNLIRPEYIYRPRQILTRIGPKLPHGKVVVTLPWKLPLTINPREVVGHGIWLHGVFDLPATETLWRLTEPSDLTVDVGANIGYMTSIFAARSHKVLVFEPHPEIYKRLSANVAAWNKESVELFNLAASDHAGQAFLSIPEAFTFNEGLAAIGESGISIQTIRLDELISSAVGVMKIDVEGHELNVLKGVPLHLVRDIVFEEHGACPSPVTEYLSLHGFSIFRIERRFKRPLLTKAEVQHPDIMSPNYLATKEPERALRLLDLSGWQSLRT